MFRPGADVREQDNPEESQKRKPRETRLSLREHEGGEKRTERGAHTHERSRSEDGGVAGGQRQSEQASQADTHAHSEGIGLRAAVGIKTDERSEEHTSELQSQSTL